MIKPTKEKCYVVLHNNYVMQDKNQESVFNIEEARQLILATAQESPLEAFFLLRVISKHKADLNIKESLI